MVINDYVVEMFTWLLTIIGIDWVITDMVKFLNL